jgi:hypothetical protein
MVAKAEPTVAIMIFFRGLLPANPRIEYLWISMRYSAASCAIF